MQPEPVVRDATPDDLDAALAIYGREAREGYATFETEQPATGAWRAKITGPEPFLVAVGADGEVVGIAYASEFRPRPAYHLTRETSIYLSPGATGRGTGTRLYASLLDRLRAGGAHTALALVSQPNDASLALHERLGFTRVGTMREVGDKLGRLIDVVVLQVML